MGHFGTVRRNMGRLEDRLPLFAGDGAAAVIGFGHQRSEATLSEPYSCQPLSVAVRVIASICWGSINEWCIDHLQPHFNLTPQVCANGVVAQIGFALYYALAPRGGLGNPL